MAEAGGRLLAGLRFTLIWAPQDAMQKLQLLVRCPSGRMISQDARTQPGSGGSLDVDRLVHVGGRDVAVQNVAFDCAPPGLYNAFVTDSWGDQAAGSAATPWTACLVGGCSRPTSVATRTRELREE